MILSHRALLSTTRDVSKLILTWSPRQFSDPFVDLGKDVTFAAKKIYGPMNKCSPFASFSTSVVNYRSRIENYIFVLVA
jgi:hypothetical protein